MNKREAIAYAQVTLDYMQSSKYKGELNINTFAIEMKQCFKLYPKDIILNIANAQLQSLKKLKSVKNGCDTNE